MNRGIHQRGYLPHWDFPKSVQAITFRLADSVPKATLESWHDELLSLDDLTRQHELHRRIARYEDAGHGCCLLRNDGCADVIQELLIGSHQRSYKLLAWVIMPNHVHTLIRLLGGASLSTVVQHWKGASAARINRQLTRSGPMWAPDYYDRYIRDEDHLHDCIAYIRNNPVKAGLCKSPNDWRWSSAGIDWQPDRGLQSAPASRAVLSRRSLGVGGSLGEGGNLSLMKMRTKVRAPFHTTTR